MPCGLHVKVSSKGWRVQIHPESRHICLVICLLGKNELPGTVFSCFSWRGSPLVWWPKPFGLGMGDFIPPKCPFHLLAPQFQGLPEVHGKFLGVPPQRPKRYDLGLFFTLLLSFVIIATAPLTYISTKRKVTGLPLNFYTRNQHKYIGFHFLTIWLAIPVPPSFKAQLQF